MRRALIYTAFILSWLCAAAQSRDVVDTSAATYDTVQYFAPKVNPIRYFGSPFCNHFAEIRLFTGLYDAGVGLDYTYLPEIWGFNLAGNVGYANLWLSGGAAYRLSKPWSRYDWHLYGNVGVCCEDGSFRHVRPSLEAGIRWASPEGMRGFCYSSGTLGVMTNFDGLYVTFGLGLSVGTLFSLILLFL